LCGEEDGLGEPCRYEIAIAESKTAARGKIGLDKRYLL
jgi:hypothetical protein